MGLGVLALIEFTGMVVAYLRPGRARTKTGERGTVIEAGSVDTFSLNSVTAFVRGRFYLCRLDDGGFLALSGKCTHLGCTIPWLDKEQRFACPCHASAFDVRGQVVNPPAPRALDRYEVRIENRIVKVNLLNIAPRAASGPSPIGPG